MTEYSNVDFLKRTNKNKWDNKKKEIKKTKDEGYTPDWLIAHRKEQAIKHARTLNKNRQRCKSCMLFDCVCQTKFKRS